MTFSFRKFAKRTALAAAFGIAALGGYGYFGETQMLNTTTYDIDTPKWNQPEINIAMAADFHVGSPSVSLDRLVEIVEAINATKPDIILLPGDFLTMIEGNRVIGGDYVAPAPIAEVLKDLRAPLGVYAVLGNHDMMNEPANMKAALEKAGITVLVNDAVHVKSGKFDFWVAGLADDTTAKPDWAAVEKKITGGAPVILVMHDPGAFLDKMDRPALSVAGHTHGGQVFPWVIKHVGNPYSRAPMKYLYGHISEDGRELIVTSGIGTSIVPLRIGSPPEIVKIKLGPKSPQPGS